MEGKTFRVYPYFYLFHLGIGEVPFISFFGGFIAVLFKSPKKFILPVSFAFVFMFVMTVYSNGGIYPRNFTTVMPYLMIFAGYLMYILHVILRKFLKKGVSLNMIIMLLIVINFSPAKDS